MPPAPSTPSYFRLPMSSSLSLPACLQVISDLLTVISWGIAAQRDISLIPPHLWEKGKGKVKLCWLEHAEIMTGSSSPSKQRQELERKKCLFVVFIVHNCCHKTTPWRNKTSCCTHFYSGVHSEGESCSHQWDCNYRKIVFLREGCCCTQTLDFTSAVLSLMRESCSAQWYVPGGISHQWQLSVVWKPLNENSYL